MLAVTALGFILTGAATLIGFARLDADYNAARLVRKEGRRRALALAGRHRRHRGGHVLSWTVMPGTSPIASWRLRLYRDCHWLSIAWTAACLRLRPSVTGKRGVPTEVDPDVLIALAQGGTVGSANGQRGLPRLLVSVELSGTPRVSSLCGTHRVLEASGRLDFVRNLGAVFALVFAAAIALAFC